MSFLNIKENGSSPSGKTKRWNVSSETGPTLGDIRWFAPWRKYVFQSALALFDEACLTEIAEFIERETRAHRKVTETDTTKE